MKDASTRDNNRVVAWNMLQERDLAGQSKSGSRQPKMRSTRTFELPKRVTFTPTFLRFCWRLLTTNTSPAVAEWWSKERFTQYLDLLEETKERLQLARILEDDKQRETRILEDAIFKLVVPGLQWFTREKELSRSKLQDSIVTVDSIC